MSLTPQLTVWFFPLPKCVEVYYLLLHSLAWIMSYPGGTIVFVDYHIWVEDCLIVLERYFKNSSAQLALIQT